ncbi:hypothetical protein K435DRAFT_49203 [Dendrothele bispora CBS 962.96]|uniref:Uncharacterized protein n=1 Tax=Dendrothele bispora (strain CBS 962.96) TaxID=1314807 RepID=A0A4S8KS67_DENBC|nr:hypothetical protein K435DRAFT_49203 [Dendrothele bispora CBS 962.96]
MLMKPCYPNYKRFNYFLRRLLGLNSHSMLILFTETGPVPIRYMRLQLALMACKLVPIPHVSCKTNRVSLSGRVTQVLCLISKRQGS